MDASEGRLKARVRGEIGSDDGVLVVRRIDVTYELQAAEEHRPVIERVHALHAEKCPVARTLRGCVDIETHLEIRPPE